jgi:DNA replication factor GINS
MNLDELQSVQNKERQSSSLQHLRASFYQEAGEFVQELRDRRDAAAAEADDPFGSEEVRRLTDDMETAQRTVESLYERRVGKVVKMASIAAADMPYDDEGLTEEEADLFETLVSQIKQNREAVLSVLDGETGSITCSRTDGEPAADDTPPGAGTPTEPDVRPPDVTADRPSPAETAGAAASPSPGESSAEGETPPAPPEDQGLDIGGAMGAGDQPSSESGGAPTDVAPDATPPGGDPRRQETDADPDGVDRRVVRITGDVGDIFGVDGRTYDLSSDDVVDLPEENASILVGQDNAEPLE